MATAITTAIVLVRTLGTTVTTGGDEQSHDGETQVTREEGVERPGTLQCSQGYTFLEVERRIRRLEGQR